MSQSTTDQIGAIASGALTDLLDDLVGMSVQGTAELVKILTPMATRAAIERVNGSPTAEVSMNHLRAQAVAGTMMLAIRDGRATAQRMADMAEAVVAVLAKVAVGAVL